MMPESVFLLNPPFRSGYSRDACLQATGRAGTFRYPIWLAYATAQLIPHIPRIRMMDAVAQGNDLETIMKEIRKFNPSVIVVNMNWASLEEDQNVASKLKELFQYHAEVLAFGCPAKVSDIELFHQLTGNEEPLNHPWVTPIYNLFLNIQDYRLAECFYPVVQLWAHGKTCPQGCIFCNKIIRRVGFVNYRDSVDEIEWAMENLKVRPEEFHYDDDDFTIDKDWAEAFCAEVRRRRLDSNDFVWSCQTRADVSANLANVMSHSGCRLVICGFENGADSMLFRIKKGFTVAQNVRFAQNIRKSGMLLQADLIIGLPDETRETIEMTRKLIKKISPDILQVAIATPYPNTEFYDWVRSNKFMISAPYVDSYGQQECVIQYPNLTRKEIKDAVDQTLKSYYLSWRFAVRAAHQVFRKNGRKEMKRLLWSMKQFRL